MYFLKAHNFSNDFIIIDARLSRQFRVKNYAKLARELCDRHRGVGADGCLVVLRSAVADVRMKIVNADGSMAQMCGNGINCLVRYLVHRKATKKTQIAVETEAGIIGIQLLKKSGVLKSTRVKLGDMQSKAFATKDYTVNALGKKWRVTTLTMGVSHGVIFVKRLDANLLAALGPLIAGHRFFPGGINVNLARVTRGDSLEILTYERGVGITMACGTGAAAVAVAAQKQGKVTDGITGIYFANGGKVLITLGADDGVYITSPAAEIICEGQVLLGNRK